MDALTTAYLVAFVAGGAFGVLSWALGAHGHHGHGNAHAHLGHGHGHPHVGHAPVHGHHPLPAARWINPLANLTAWAALACIGGAVGFLSRRAGISAPLSLLYAAPSGFLAAVAVGGLVSALSRGTRYVEPLPEGLVATVIARIGEHTTGEVMYVHHGARHSLPARSANGAPIEADTEVIVLDVEAGIARVQTSAELLRVEEGHRPTEDSPDSGRGS
jgi:hypothetical protein